MNSESLRPQPVARRVRAWFAPVARATGTPAVFDPSKHDPLAPGTPWIDVGQIDRFTRTPVTKHELLRAGAKSAATAQVRRRLEARVEFDFRDWGKLQMALSGGSQHMNVLASDVNADPFPSGGSPSNAVALLPTSTAQELVVGPGALEGFGVGEIVAVDLDYQQQTGYVGSGIAGAFVSDPADVLRDRHYVRRVTFNVGRIAELTTTSLILTQPLLAGIPPQDACVQKVSAFVDREGGCFFQEWSALFVAEDESGARICFHYPRLQPAAPAAEWRADIHKPFEAWSLRVSLLALPTSDINDGEQVLCYRSYFPAAASALY